MSGLFNVGEFLANAKTDDLQKRLPRLLHSLLRHRDQAVSNLVEDNSAIPNTSVDNLLKQVGNERMLVKRQPKKLSDLSFRDACHFAIRRNYTVASPCNSSIKLVESLKAAENCVTDYPKMLNKLAVTSIRHFLKHNIELSVECILQLMRKMNTETFAVLARYFGATGMQEQVQQVIENTKSNRRTGPAKRRRITNKTGWHGQDLASKKRRQARAKKLQASLNSPSKCSEIVQNHVASDASPRTTTSDDFLCGSQCGNSKTQSAAEEEIDSDDLFTSLTRSKLKSVKQQENGVLPHPKSLLFAQKIRCPADWDVDAD